MNSFTLSVVGGRGGKQQPCSNLGAFDNGDEDGTSPGFNKETIVSVNNQGIETKESILKGEEWPLVIPLTRNPWEKDENGGSKSDGDGKTEERILKDEEIDNDSVSTRKEELPRKRRAPLLTSGAVPGLKDMIGEQDKFLHDVSSRADDIGVDSDAYRSVPIAAFGEAMLRGMGWKGPPADGKEDPNAPRLFEPRHHRLGLGATPKPPEERNDSGRPRIRRPGEVPSRRDKEEAKGRKMWEEKARQKTSDMLKLSIGGVVKFKDGRPGRAMILLTRVDGEDGRLRLRLERGGEEVVVHNDKVTLLREDDLAKHPFMIQRDGGEEEKLRKEFKTHVEEESRRKRRPHKDEKEESYKHKKHKRTKHNHKESKLEQDWLMPKIRVRIVSNKYGSRMYAKKGVILDVPERGIATLRMDDSCHLLDNVRQSHLESVVPKIKGSKTILIRGPDRGSICHLMARNLESQQAVVQLFDEMDVKTVSLDDLAEYTGLMDRDDDCY